METGNTEFPRRLVYSIEQAVELSTLSRQTLWRAHRRGELRMTRKGGRTLIPADDLVAFLTPSGKSR